MVSKAITEQIQQLTFADPTDLNRFAEEVNALSNHEFFGGLIHKNTISVLKALYLTQLSKRSPLELAFKIQNTDNQKNTSFLVDYFSAFAKSNTTFPTKAITAEVFLHLCERQFDEPVSPQGRSHLTMLLQSDLLAFYQADRIQELKFFDRENFNVLVEFFQLGKTDFSEAQLRLAFDILNLLYPTSLGKDAAQHLSNYFKEIIPTFVKRFEHRMNEETLFQNPDRFAEWYMVWNRHLLKLVLDETEGTDFEDEAVQQYYETDFKTIVQYVPEFLWWNNGFFFNGNNKNFHFGSPCFIHLAIGGSIRKAPDWRHYTRRMAKTLMNLPYYFNQQEYDMYIYAYCQSLGARPLLSKVIQQYMRHPDNMPAMQEEMDRWNPIIQKLTDDIFENINENTAYQFLGYLYHCLRDQPEFSVQGRPIMALLEESYDYYERIAARARMREEARQERERLRAAHAAIPKIIAWTKHAEIQPYKYQSYQIIELINETMLAQEGRVMNHCVGTYTDRCNKGHCSIWSLRQINSNNTKNCVTIEIDKRKTVIQMRGRFNASPSTAHKKIIEDWMKIYGISYSQYV